MTTENKKPFTNQLAETHHSCANVTNTIKAYDQVLVSNPYRQFLFLNKPLMLVHW